MHDQLLNTKEKLTTPRHKEAKKELPDKVLFEKVKAGDLKAFEILFKSFYAILVDYAKKYVNNIEDAEEITQELFSNLWEKRENIQIHSSVKSYLFRSIHNNCLLFLQHKTVEMKYENYVKSKDIASEPDPMQSLKANELYMAMQKVLGRLSERTGKIFRMSRFEGLKYNEIAEQLDISVKTVEANMGKALKALRENLKDYLQH